MLYICIPSWLARETFSLFWFLVITVLHLMCNVIFTRLPEIQFCQKSWRFLTINRYKC
jgi:hypothetical protein